MADPEALILFTVEIARRDPRLFDEVMDWMSLNGRLLSLQRLRNLTSRFPLDRKLLDAIVAWVGRSAPSLRWPKAIEPTDELKGEGIPLFSPGVVTFMGDTDPVFLHHGYRRPRATRSRKSNEPDPHKAINFAFRLRLLFGPGGRSEVMRILLTHTDGPLDAARIADEAGFAKRNVSEVLTALVESGAANARWAGNERVFVSPKDKWATVFATGIPDPTAPFVSWVHLLPPLVEVLLWLETEEQADDSEYVASSRARDLVHRIGADLEVVDVAPPADRSFPGVAYLAPFDALVGSLLAAIEPR